MDAGGTTLKTGIYCRGCGYDLRESELRCPECGRAFERAKRRTFYSSPSAWRMWKWTRRLLLLLLLVTLPPALGLGWLWWGWRQEQNALAALDRVGLAWWQVQPLHAWLPMCLPAGWSFLTQRTTYAGIDNVELAPEDLQCLARLMRLRSVQFSDAAMTNAHLRHLGALAQLEELVYAQGRGITDEGLAHLSALNRMQVLTLWNTSITGSGLKHLKAMPLRHLALTNSQLDDKGAALLSEFRELEYLDLSYARITDTGMEHLSGLTEMRRLYLSGTSISDDGLRHLAGMAKLEDLVLCGTAITDAGLEHLKGSQQLRFLNVGDTRITPAGLHRLRQALPGLDIAYKSEPGDAPAISVPPPPSSGGR